jgi:hypothetical protein
MILLTSIWRGFPDCKRAFGFMLAHEGVGCDNDDILDTLDVMFYASLFSSICILNQNLEMNSYGDTNSLAPLSKFAVNALFFMRPYGCGLVSLQ